MTRETLWPGIDKPVIGMLHLRPLPGAPRYDGDAATILSALLGDAEGLVAGGVHGLMLENFGDAPFYPQRVPAAVISHMTALAVEVRRRFPEHPLGVNVLRNDGRSALAVAQAAGAAFIRVNVLCGARVTDQGIIQGIAHDLLRERASLGAAPIRIFADVDVKHSAAWAARPLADEVHDTIERGLADAVIVSGVGTGRAASLDDVHAVKSAAGETPVFIGSGITAETAADYWPQADGFIIGTAFKRDAIPTHPVDGERVRGVMRKLRSL